MYILRSLILVSVILFNQEGSFAQKCKYDVDETDKFTGASKKEIKLRLTENVIGTFKKINEDRFLQILYGFKLDKDLGLKMGDGLYLVFENGDKLTLQAKDDVSPVTGVGGSGGYSPYVYSSYTIEYPMTAENAELFTKSMLTDMKIQIANEEHQQEVPSKFAKNILKVAHCFR